MKNSSKTILLTVAIVLTGLAVFWKFSKKEGQPSVGQDRTITVLSYGGAFADAQRKAYFKPFSDSKSATVKEDTYDGEYGKLKAAVESGVVPWDVVDLESSALLRGIRDQLFEKIDYTKISTNDLNPEAIHEFAVATDFYSVSLGFSTKRFPESGTQPKTWRDFWDVERFPGPRSLKKDPRFTLEVALLADGVNPQDIYANGELDVDRAFRSLDRIKKNVSVWWTSGQQPVQLLADGEIAMAAAFGARMYNAAYVDNKPLAMTWNQGIVDTEYWVILKHSKNPTLAHEFIDFASGAEPQAAFSLAFPLGPVNKKAFDRLPPNVASRLNSYPTNLSQQIFLNATYWAKHEESIRERFNNWLTQ